MTKTKVINFIDALIIIGIIALFTSNLVIDLAQMLGLVRVE